MPGAMPSVMSLTARTVAPGRALSSIASSAAASSERRRWDRSITNSDCGGGIEAAMLARVRHTCEPHLRRREMSVSMLEQEAADENANGTGTRPKVLIHQPIKSIPWTYDVERSIFAGRGV